MAEAVRRGARVVGGSRASLAVPRSFDPEGRVARLLTGDPDLASGGAQQELLRWLKTLPATVDPAAAASALLHLGEPCEDFARGGAAVELRELLWQVAAVPRPLLRRIVAGRRARRRRRLKEETPWIDIPGTGVKVRGVDWL